MPYRLAASIQAHAQDVRAVAAPSDNLVLTASRDCTAAAWARPSADAANAAPFALRQAFPAAKYVNAVAYIPPSPSAPSGYVVAAGSETVIHVYPLDAPGAEPAYTLVGHTENVCTLATSPSGLIVSGSWDRTARVWRDFQQLYELRGHEQSVWAVQIVDEGEQTVLTASADNSIRLWKQNKTLHVYTGHTSAVRGLALMPELGFASCANDGAIRIWTLEGDALFTLSGHTSFVYSLTVLPDGKIASGGEDRTLRIWRDEECVQTIVHPATSVWSVASMPNGDVVTGSSDGFVRVFSAAEERWVSAEELKQYDELVASQALPSQQVGDVKKSDLPGLEALTTPGSKPGEVKMVRNGGAVEAHQWDSASSSWQKIGEVVDAVGSGRKQLYEGKEYDYVFDVDIQDGVPPLKLPFNVNENPYSAAQRFLARHELPMSYLDEVVRFIEQNTSGVSLGGGSEFVDPFTGASRYQAAPSQSTSATGSFGDPFTGAARYQASSSATPPANSSSSTGTNLGDPLTGGARYMPAGTSSPAITPAPAPAARTSTIIPVTTFLSFKQGNVNAMRGKIREFDEAFQHEISTSAMAMYPTEATMLEEAYVYLTEAVANASSIKAKPLGKAHLETIIQILERWPPSSRFPVIDLARLVIGYCPDSYADPESASHFLSSVLHAAEWGSPWGDGSAPLPKYRETNVLLALRALANAFQETTAVSAGTCIGSVLREVANAPYGVLVRNHRVALATLLFNLSCVRLRSPLPEEESVRHLQMILTILREEKNDAETAYRALVALGNILHSLKTHGSTLSTSQAGEVRSTLPSVSARFSEERVAAVRRDIESLL